MVGSLQLFVLTDYLQQSISPTKSRKLGTKVKRNSFHDGLHFSPDYQSPAVVSDRPRTTGN